MWLTIFLLKLIPSLKKESLLVAESEHTISDQVGEKIWKICPFLLNDLMRVGSNMLA